MKIHSKIRFSKPIMILEQELTVFDVLNWLANGMTINDIIEDYSET